MRARVDVAAEVCARISAGDSVREIFSGPADDYPSVSTWWKWIGTDPEVRAAYDAAVLARGEKYAEEIAAIADEQPPMEQTEHGEKHDTGFVSWQKNRIEARKWIASRLIPKKYGDRTILSGDPDNPVEVRHSVAGRLLPELAPVDATESLERIDGAGSGRPRLRVAAILGEGRPANADGSVDVLADHGGPRMGQDKGRSGTG